jgi:hypothetical protein
MSGHWWLLGRRGLEGLSLGASPGK